MGGSLKASSLGILPLRVWAPSRPEEPPWWTHSEGRTQGRRHPFELGILFLILSGALVFRALPIQAPLMP